MFRDLRAEADGVRFDADVCVVGAGPAGITLACELLGSTIRVLLVESGGMEPSADVDVLNHGESAGLAFLGLRDGRTRAFGGTTKLWDGQCLPLADLDFEARSWVAHSGWPITAAEMRPFYARARSALAIPEHVNDEWIARRFASPSPAFDGGKLRPTFSVISHRLDLGRRHREALAAAPNVQVVLHANATRVHAGEQAAAERLEIRTLEGKTGTVTARAFVLCGGGIENARLLLLSNGAEPSGLGNRHDLVGRFFQEHPVVYPAVLETASPAALQRHYDLLRDGRRRYLPKMLLSDDVQRSRRVLNGMADVLYEYDGDSPVGAAKDIYRSLREGRWPDRFAAKARRALEDVGTIATTLYRRWARGRLTPPAPTRARLRILLEQAPDPGSRVTLSHERDALGLPRARVDWRLTDLERRTAEAVTETVGAELERLGVARLRAADWLADGRADWTDHVREAYHHMGTTRMADDPRHGVVDRDCRVHGVSGVYVCGSSVFPTSGSANPTLTIVALAMRLADHLKTVMRRAPSVRNAGIHDVRRAVR